MEEREEEEDYSHYYVLGTGLFSLHTEAVF